MTYDEILSDVIVAVLDIIVSVRLGIVINKDIISLKSINIFIGET